MYSWIVKLKNIFLILVGLTLVSGVTQPLQALEYQALGEGLAYASWQIPQGITVLHLLRIDLENFEIRPILASAFGQRADSVQNLAESSKALAAINANFFDENKRALGLVLLREKILSAPQNTSWWAALLLKNHTAQIKKIQTQSQVEGFRHGIQAGPRLVVAGKAMKLKSENSAKSAVGLNRQGYLFLIATDGPIEINQLAQILARPESQGGIGLTQALNLDGGSSAQFFLKTKEKKLSLPGLVKVPVALGVFPRTAPR